MATYEIVEGWTAPVDITLLSKRAAPEGTMAGMTAELILQDRDGVVIDTAGDMTIPDVNEWVVRYTPDSDDLVEGEYRMRIKVTDSGGRVSYFPNGHWDTLKVYVEA